MDMSNYYAEMTKKALEGYKRINNTDQVENKKYEVPNATWDVDVVRGKVLEKATVTRVSLRTKHPITGEDTRFHALQSKVYPANPKIPVLVFIIEHMVAQDDFFSGMMDVIAPAPIEEDLTFLGAEMKKVCEKHGEEYEPLRDKGAQIFKLEPWKKPINAGVGIHNPTAKERVEMIKEEGQVWLSSYLNVVEKRINEPFTDEDVERMNAIRARILEYYYLGDISLPEAMKLGIPLEAINLMLLAPVIRY
jgi:coproporphyrinogen III oxidase